MKLENYLRNDFGAVVLKNISFANEAIVPSLLLHNLFMCHNLFCRGFGKTCTAHGLKEDTEHETMYSVNRIA